MTDSDLTFSCEEADDLAGLFVLDALTPAEAAAVAEHLATCPEAHATFADLAAVTPALVASVEPVEAPAQLRDRVMRAIAVTPQAPEAPEAQVAPQEPVAPPVAAVPPPDAATRVSATPRVAQAVPITQAAAPTTPVPVSIERERARRRNGSGRTWLALAAAAVIAIAGLLGWNVILQGRAGDAERRVAVLRDAIAAREDPTSDTAALVGSGSAAGATGFAVFPATGTGYIVLQGLPAIPGGQTYQAWSLVGGQPASVGLMSVGSDGFAILTGVARLPGTDTVALTVEPAGGSPGPTTQPIVVGQLRVPIASVIEVAFAR